MIFGEGIESRQMLIKTTIRKLFLIAITVSLLLSCAEEKVKTKPVLTSMTESVYASITILPEELYKVYASSSGILDNIYIDEGDLVKKGQNIARIKAENSQINVENAQLSVELIREKYKGSSNTLENIMIEIQTAQKQLQLDSTNLVRQQNLWRQNIGSQTELDARKLKYDLTLNNLSILRKKYTQTKLDLDNQYRLSQNNLKKAKTTSNDFVIKSKISGKVYDLYKETGEFINAQEPLAQIGKGDQFIIEMVIDEVDITKIQIGQLAIIDMDAYPNQTFKASIDKIYPLKDSRSQTFKIEGHFTQAPETLYAGLSGEANILISEQEDILTIPLDYLVDNSHVLTEDGLIEISTGMNNMKHIEIQSGIDTSTVIIKP